jgi:branched-chain amino acid transport system permease protein
LIIVPLFFSALGIPLYYFLFRRMVGQPYPPQLLYTTALSISIQNALLVTFSWNDRYIAIPMRMDAFKVGSIFFNKVLVLSFLISIIVSITVFYFLYRTERGTLIRATISNRDLMSLLGIDPHRIYLQAFCLAMGLTAIGSVLLNFYYPVFPTIGSLYTSLMFVAIVLGGIGTIRGCILGGLIIGITQIVTSTFSYLNFQNIAIFIIFIVFVVFKPQGLLGSRRRTGRRGG